MEYCEAGSLMDLIEICDKRLTEAQISAVRVCVRAVRWGACHYGRVCVRENCISDSQVAIGGRGLPVVVGGGIAVIARG